MSSREDDPTTHDLYRWQCEAERCYFQRDRLGHWHPRGRDMGTDDPGAGHRYHPECTPLPILWPDASRTTPHHGATTEDNRIRS